MTAASDRARFAAELQSCKIIAHLEWFVAAVLSVAKTQKPHPRIVLCGPVAVPTPALDLQRRVCRCLKQRARDFISSRHFEHATTPKVDNRQVCTHLIWSVTAQYNIAVPELSIAVFTPALE